MIGEIGGSAEEEAVRLRKAHVTKPSPPSIAGRNRTSRKNAWGSAGAIISGAKEPPKKKSPAYGRRRHCPSLRARRRNGRRRASSNPQA